jgi:hypothetical protein
VAIGWVGRCLKTIRQGIVKKKCCKFIIGAYTGSIQLNIGSGALQFAPFERARPRGPFNTCHRAPIRNPAAWQWLKGAPTHSQKKPKKKKKKPQRPA